MDKYKLLEKVNLLFIGIDIYFEFGIQEKQEIVIGIFMDVLPFHIIKSLVEFSENENINFEIQYGLVVFFTGNEIDIQV
jgi:hypothetical protein